MRVGFTFVSVALAVLATNSLGAREGIQLDVSPRFAYEPSTVNVEVVIEQDAANRAVDVVADSENFYRSSRVELEGANAPRVTTMRFRDLPAGDYDIRAMLYTDGGHERAIAHRAVTIMEH